VAHRGRLPARVPACTDPPRGRNSSAAARSVSAAARTCTS